MATYHNVRFAMVWDPKLRVCTDDELLFFFHLIQIERQNCAGIFRASVGQLCADFCGRFTEAQAKKCIDGLQDKSLLIYDEGWMWLIGTFKNLRSGNASTFVNAKRALEDCGSKLIFDSWWTKYANARHVKEWIGQMEWQGGDQSRNADVRVPTLIPERGPTDLMKESVDRVWTFYCQTMQFKGSLTDKRKGKILERLRETITDPTTGERRRMTVDDLMLAIVNCSMSDWHMGRDPKTAGHIYNSLEDNILKNLEQVEKWIREGSRPDARPAETLMETHKSATKTLDRMKEAERNAVGPEHAKAAIDDVMKKLGKPVKEEVFE
jgi:hypothetical protein